MEPSGEKDIMLVSASGTGKTTISFSFPVFISKNLIISLLHPQASKELSGENAKERKLVYILNTKADWRSVFKFHIFISRCMDFPEGDSPVAMVELSGEITI